MQLLFNENNDGQTEIKAVLGFLDGGFTYANLETDIKLNTPYLIDMVGSDVYNTIAGYYVTPGSPGTPLEEQLELALHYSRTYILSLAYLDFAPDNDLKHSNSGRTFSSTENEKIPWEWQVDKSDSSIRRRAYRALDQLMALLDESEWPEWTGSDQYKRANRIFIKNTLAFDKVFPIQRSGQLYYRLVPFMEDFENDKVRPILTPTVFDDLKAADAPTDDQKKLLEFILKAVAYLALGKGLKAFPVEMMPDGLRFQEDTKSKSEVRAETMQFLNSEGEKYLRRLEFELEQQNLTFEQIHPVQGLDEDEKFVSL